MIPCSDFVLVLEHELFVHVPLIDDLIGDLDVHMPIFPLQEVPISLWLKATKIAGGDQLRSFGLSGYPNTSCYRYYNRSWHLCFAETESSAEQILEGKTRRIPTGEWL